MTVGQRRERAPEGVTRTRCAACKRFARLLDGQTECDSCSGGLPLDFGRRASARDQFLRMIAGKQAVAGYLVELYGRGTTLLRLTQAQAEGYECLTCKIPCGQGSAAFRPVGHIADDVPGTSQVFRCVACLGGAAGGDAR